TTHISGGNIDYNIRGVGSFFQLGAQQK
nr:envelope protein 2 variant 401 [Hepacivirus hominis]